MSSPRGSSFFYGHTSSALSITLADGHAPPPRKPNDCSHTKLFTPRPGRSSKCKGGPLETGADAWSKNERKLWLFASASFFFVLVFSSHCVCMLPWRLLYKIRGPMYCFPPNLFLLDFSPYNTRSWPRASVQGCRYFPLTQCFRSLDISRGVFDSFGRLFCSIEKTGTVLPLKVSILGSFHLPFYFFVRV